MAYDEELAARVRQEMEGRPGMTEKHMFGGVAFLLGGNMACGVNGDSLIIRLAPEDSEAALDEPATRRFDMTGRPMKGWIVVDAGGITEEEELRRWVERGVAYARSLPPK
jgi:hypothetical protein